MLVRHMLYSKRPPGHSIREIKNMNLHLMLAALGFSPVEMEELAAQLKPLLTVPDSLESIYNRLEAIEDRLHIGDAHDDRARID